MQALETGEAYLAEHGNLLGVFIAAAFVGLGVKVVKGSAATGGGSSQNVSSPVPEEDSPEERKDDDKADENGREKQQEAQKQIEKQKEDERLRNQEKLNELFDLAFDGKEKTEDENQKENEKDDLGDERKNLDKLKEQYKGLVVEISALIEKGLTAEQTAKSLVFRTTEQVPEMEFQPLIEAMMLFLKKNETAEKNTAVIGMDPQFEQRAALSALKRGDYEIPVGFLERQAEDAVREASSSHRSDVCEPALEQAAALYQAIGVLTRPSNPEKSFEALKKSKELNPENTVTDAMIARAYYESGKVKKAEKSFENIAGNGKDYAARYAAQMVCEIRTQRTMQHAGRIREEYEKRLGDAEGRQKTDELSLQQRKRAEVMRANSRFIADGLHDRDNEYERV